MGIAVDITARRQGETNAQWTARLNADHKPIIGPLVTTDMLRHGDYRDEFVTHVETNTRAKAARNRQTSALALMLDKGQITQDQFGAAQQIARVAEMIERNAAVQCASLEARVDCSGSGRNPLVESLSRVRMERTYSQWRDQLPMPRRMILDMILADRGMKATARRFNCGWPRAMRLLSLALDRWNDIYARVTHQIDQQDVDAAHARLTRAR